MSDNPNSNKLTDAELISLVLQGNKQFFGELIRRYQSQVASTITAMIGNCEEVEDVGQEVFIRFFRALETFRGESSVGTFLTRIAINLSLNALKKRKRLLQRFVGLSEKNEYAHDAVEVDLSESSDIKELLERALQKLDEGIRAVVVMRLMNGYSVKETAEILNLPQGTVLSRLSRGQKQLKDVLSKSNYYG
ncbi:MAG: RNA polymerase sigma factor [Bacteroidales bacterium]|nr:RNA polymerase sigma factor [Bacteroidales bacterium]